MCCSVNDACCFGGKLFLFLSNSFDVSPHLVVGRSLLPMASGAQKQRTGMGGLLWWDSHSWSSQRPWVARAFLSSMAFSDWSSGFQCTVIVLLHSCIALPCLGCKCLQLSLADSLILLRLKYYKYCSLTTPVWMSMCDTASACLPCSAQTVCGSAAKVIFSSCQLTWWIM